MSENVTWLRSRRQPDLDSSPTPLFIYHVPKTGTTTVYAALHRALSVRYSLRLKEDPGFDPPRIGRLDDPALLDEKGSIEGRFGLVATHLPFGFHSRFRHDFRLITLVRAPVERIVSGYTYACMRARKVPTPDGFRTYFEDPDNRNAVTRQFGGSAALAIENIDAAFAIHGTTAHIAVILEGLLSGCGLPNVMIERLNKTEPGYRFDSSGFRDEVSALNSDDETVFRRIDAAPHLPPAPPDDAPLHPITVLVRETANDDFSSIATKVVPTETLAGLGMASAIPNTEFHRVFERF